MRGLTFVFVALLAATSAATCTVPFHQSSTVPGSSVSLNGDARALQMYDLDADGDLDLFGLETDSNGNKLSCSFTTTMASFASSQLLPTLGSVDSRGFAVADFYPGQGPADVVVGFETWPYLQMLRATTTSPAAWEMPENVLNATTACHAVAVVDLDADGTLDIVFGQTSGLAVLYSPAVANASTPVVVFDGAIADARKLVPLVSPTAGPGVVGYSPTHRIAFMNATGAAFPLIPTAAAVSEVYFDTADVDGDGEPDVVVSQAGVCTLVYSAATPEASTAVIPHLDSITGVSLFDFNGDGTIDLSAASYTGMPSGPDWWILNGFGRRRFASSWLSMSDTAAGMTYDMITGDVYGNGMPTTIKISGKSPNTPWLEPVYGGAYQGEFVQSHNFVTISSSEVAVASAAGDVNADGAPDFVFISETDFLGIIINSNPTSIGSPVIATPAMGGSVVALGDVTGRNDGTLDAVIFSDTLNATFVARYTGGAVTFGPLELLFALESNPGFGMRRAILFHIFDANSDDLVDIVLTAPGGLWLYIPVADTLAELELPADTWGVATAADFDGNGLQDLAVLTNKSDVGFFFQSAAGFGPFELQYTSWEVTVLPEITSADMTGDGVPDIVCAEQGSRNMMFGFEFFRHNNSIGGRTDMMDLPTWNPKHPRFPQAVHFTNTGAALVIQDGAMLRAFPSPFTAIWASFLVMSNEPKTISFADFDLDGYPDAVLQEATMSIRLVRFVPSAFVAPRAVVEVELNRPRKSLAAVAAAFAYGSSCYPRTVRLDGLAITACELAAGFTVPSGSIWTLENGVVDCGDAGGVVAVVEGGASLSLDGITLRNATFGTGLTAGAPFRVEDGGSMWVKASTIEGASSVGAKSTQVDSGLGGVFAVLSSASLTIESSQLVSNSAGTAGGVIAVTGNGASVSLDTVSVVGNVAFGSGTAGGGGAVAVMGAGATVTVTNCIFDGNVALHGSGGAVFVASGAASATVVVDGTTISSSSAALAGGAVAVAAEASVVLGSATVVTGAKAGWGGCVASYADAVFPVPTSPYTLVLAPAASGSGTTWATQVVASSGAVFSECSAAYGGVVFACGAGVDISAAAWAGSGPSASVAGGYAFSCALPPSDGVTPPSGWAGSAPGGMPGASAGGYGDAVATPAVRLEQAEAAASLTSGVAVGAGVVRAVDAHGAHVRGAVGVVSFAATTSASIGVSLSGVEFGAEYEASSGAAQLSRMVATADGVSDDGAELPAEVRVTMSLASSSEGRASDPQLVVTVPLTACPVGFGRVESNPGAAPGEVVCGACSAGSFSDELSVGACLPVPECLESARRNATDGTCVCKEGFTYAGVDESKSTVCVPCPRGALCEEGLAAPVAAVGFFPTEDGKFLQCIRAAACPGGGRSSATACGRGYEGYMCNTCSTGFYSDAKGECAECPPSPGKVTLAWGAAIGMGAMATGAALLLSAERQAAKLRDAGGELGGADLRTRLVPAALSLTLVAFQVVGILSDADFAWSAGSKEVFGSFNVFNVDASVMRSECSMGTFFASYQLSVGLPLVFLVITTVVVVVAAKVRRSSVLSQASVGELIDVVLFTLAPLLYIPMARSALVLFDCVQLPSGAWVLDADPGEKCYGPAWFKALPIGASATVGFVFTLPVYFWTSLRRSRGSLLAPHSFRRYGSLIRLWRLPYWWGEIGGLAKRLSLVCVAVFLSGQQLAQIGLLLAILLSGAIVVHANRPYYFEVLNVVDFRISVSLVLVLLLGGANYAERNADSATRSLDIAAIVAVVVLCVVCAHGIVTETLEIVSQRRKVFSSAADRASRVARILAAELPDLDRGLNDDVAGLIDVLGTTTRKESAVGPANGDDSTSSEYGDALELVEFDDSGSSGV